MNQSQVTQRNKDKAHLWSLGVSFDLLLLAVVYGESISQRAHQSIVPCRIDYGGVGARLIQPRLWFLVASFVFISVALIRFGSYMLRENPKVNLIKYPILIAVFMLVVFLISKRC